MNTREKLPGRAVISLADCADVVRSYIAGEELVAGDRLPAERDLAVRLGMARGRLRGALALMVRDGELWRHVGKGTFLAEAGKPIGLGEGFSSPPLDRTNPIELLAARLVVEPKLAAMAALRGTSRQLAAIREWQTRGEAAADYTTSQQAGDSWHHSVAEAAQNQLMLWMFKQLFAVRSSLDWGRLSPEAHGMDSHRVWREHAAITEAVCARYATEAERLMRLHLEALRRRIEALI